MMLFVFFLMERSSFASLRLNNVCLKITIGLSETRFEVSTASHRIEVYWSKHPVERVEIADISVELIASVYKAIKRRHEGSNTETKAGRDEVKVMKCATTKGIVCVLAKEVSRLSFTAEV